MRRAGLFVLPAALILALAAGAQPKAGKGGTKADREKLLKLDDEIRVAFGKDGGKLPEAKYKLPAADAKSFDWVRVTGLTPLHEQGAKPNCVAQAAVAALEWNWQIRNGTKAKPILSPQPVLDRLQKSGALSYGEVLNQLMLHGTAPITAYPYTGDPGPLREKVKTTYRTVGWGSVGPKGKITPEMIKKALLEHGPLVAAVYTTPLFKKYKGGVFNEHAKAPENDPTGHAVVIIGWDDRLGKGCWHIQNSWGPKWGEGGGMWIEYDCNNIGYYTYWMRAQSSQYNLPADAHKLLGDADPFHRWPSAKDVELAVTGGD
jgi:C1A family cysteine protease